jgi:hypothetical protein
MNIVWPTVIRDYVTTYIPKISQYLITMIYKLMINLLHVSAFSAIFKELCNKDKYNDGYFYRCTMHFEDSLIITHQQMH